MPAGTCGTSNAESTRQLNSTKSRQTVPRTRRVKPKVALCRRPDTLRPVSDDQPSSPSPRLICYLSPIYGLFTIADSLGKKIILLILTGVQLLVGLGILWAAGWIRLDWDGRGVPGGLRWMQTAPSDANWAYSDRKPNENDPAFWPGYRGAQRDGVYSGPAIRTDWDNSPPKQIWKTVVGGGHSSITIAKGRLFTLEQWDRGEVVTCYNLTDGRGLWRHQYEGEFDDAYHMGGVGPRTGPTYDDGRLYTLGAEGQLHCLDAVTGKLLWHLNIHERFETRNLMFGTCASPWVEGNALIITTGVRARGKSTLVALDKLSGDLLWEAEAENQAYMSPFTATLAGQKQIILGAAREMQGRSLEDGSLLWSVPWNINYNNNISQPVVIDEQHLFVSGGYGHGCGLIKFTEEDGAIKAELIWENKHLKNKFTSSVLHEGHLYGLDDGDSDDVAHLVCLEAATGKEVWRGNNYGHGQILLAQGHLVIQCETGDIALATASPNGHQEIARIPSLTGKTWNNPTLAGGRLYLRNSREMICYNIARGSEGGVTSLRAPKSEGLTILAAAFLLMNSLGCLGLGLASLRK